MIYIDYTRAIAKYPVLLEPIVCICGATRHGTRAWMSKDLVGVEAGPCAICDRPIARRYVMRTREGNEQAIERFFG